jgi:hypothetical protein
MMMIFWERLGLRWLGFLQIGSKTASLLVWVTYDITFLAKAGFI